MLSDFNAYVLARQLHRSCKRVQVARYLQEQLGRASSSVALNIAEGSGKRTPADQARFYAIALGSLRECYAILDIEELCTAELEKILNSLGAILFKLSKPSHRTKPKNPDRACKPQTESATETETETVTVTETDP